MTEARGPYSTAELASLREALLRRRRELVDARAAHDRELADEQDRGPAPEEEEAAAHQLTQFVTTRIREGSLDEVRRIDESLARMDAGVYGVCEDCDEPIALERLRVMPYTRLCAVDAARDERDRVAHSPGRSLTL